MWSYLYKYMYNMIQVSNLIGSTLHKIKCQIKKVIGSNIYYTASSQRRATPSVHSFFRIKIQFLKEYLTPREVLWLAF